MPFRHLPVTLAASALAAFVLGMIAPPCQARAIARPIQSASARKAIQALYNSEDAAAARKDIGGVFAQTAPDFRAIDQNGQTISLAQAKANIADLFSRAQSVQGSTTIEKFRLVGNTAVVMAKSRDIVVYTDANTGLQGRVTIDDLSVDTWVRFGRSWMQTRSHDISQTVHRNPISSPPAYNPMLS